MKWLPMTQDSSCGVGVTSMKEAFVLGRVYTRAMGSDLEKKSVSIRSVQEMLSSTLDEGLAEGDVTGI